MHAKTMHANKHILLSALFTVTVSLFCTSCLSSSFKDVEPAVYTSAVYKEITSGDCDVTWNDSAYKVNVAEVSFYSWEKNSISRMFEWATNNGYDFTGIENQDLRDINSNKDDYKHGINTNEIVLICNILSDMDGLTPVYVFADGTPVRKLWNSRSEPVYTDTTANGWFVGVYDSKSFSIHNTEYVDYKYKADAENHLTYTHDDTSNTIAVVGDGLDFSRLLVRDYYYSSSDYSKSATYLWIPICRKASKRVSSDTPLIANAYEVTLPEGFWPYETHYHGDMFYIPEMSVMYVKDGASALSFRNAKSLFASRNIPFSYTLYPGDYLVEKLTQFTDVRLGLKDADLARFANMLSEYDGLAPCYSTLDGQVLREQLNDIDREAYESFASGWHFFKKGYARRSYYTDAVLTIFEKNGIDIDNTDDLVFYRIK